MAASAPGCTPVEGNRRAVALPGAAERLPLVPGLQPEMALQGKVDVIALREAAGPDIAVDRHDPLQVGDTACKRPLPLQGAVEPLLDGEGATTGAGGIDRIVPGDVPRTDEVRLQSAGRGDERM